MRVNDLCRLHCSDVFIQNTDFLCFCRYTSKGSSVYAIVTAAPPTTTLNLLTPKTSAATEVILLGSPSSLPWAPLYPNAGLAVLLPELPCVPGGAWTLRLDGVS